MSTAFSVLYTELGKRLHSSPSAGKFVTADLKRYLNGAIAHWGDLGGKTDVLDETTTTVADQVEYTLPTAVPNAASVIEITVEGDSNQPYAPIPGYRLADSSGALPTTATTVKLWLEEGFSDAGKKLRVRYRKAYPALTNDTDLTEVPTEWLYAYARYLAHNERATALDEKDPKGQLAFAEAAQRDAKNVMPALPYPPQRGNQKAQH